MAKKVKPESHNIRSALPLGQKREFKNAIRTQSEQLLILKKVRYLDGGDDNLPIPTEGSDLPDRAGPTSRELGWADGGLSGFFDAVVDDGASERTDGPDPSDLVGSAPLKRILMEEVIMSKNVGSTGALIHYKNCIYMVLHKDGFLAMANAGRIFHDLHYSNKDYIPVSFHEFKRHAKCSSKVSACKTATSGQAGKKNKDLHKLIFASGIFEGFSVWCVARDKGVREGRLEGSSIYCLRAGKIISPSQFEDLVGWAKWRKSYDHICLRNGVSLHQLAVCLAKNPDLSDSEKDSLRRACADLHVDEQELLHFGPTPRTFHIGVPCHLNCSPWDAITPQDQLSNYDQEVEIAMENNLEHKDELGGDDNNTAIIESITRRLVISDAGRQLWTSHSSCFIS